MVAVFFGAPGESKGQSEAGPVDVAEVDFETGMDLILDYYLDLHAQLADDRSDDVALTGRRFAVAIKKLNMTEVPFQQAPWFKHLKKRLFRAAQRLRKTTDLGSAREHFKDVSREMARWASAAEPAGIAVVYSSVAQAAWIQHHGDIQNPYFGKSMLRHGQVVGGAPLPEPKSRRRDDEEQDEGEVDPTRALFEYYLEHQF